MAKMVAINSNIVLILVITFFRIIISLFLIIFGDLKNSELINS